MTSEKPIKAILKNNYVKKKNFDGLKIKAQKIEKLVDTTGAGDLFAAGFLLGFINDRDLEYCGNEGVNFASKIIQIYGARL